MKTTTMIKEGLNARQVRVLELLSEKQQTASNMVSELISSVSLTTIVNQHVKRGLVRRKRSKKDRRQIILHITEAGKQLLTK